MDQTIQKNLSTLGVDDLIDAYDKLADSYRSLKSLNENLQQKGSLFSYIYKLYF